MNEEFIDVGNGMQPGGEILKLNSEQVENLSNSIKRIKVFLDELNASYTSAIKSPVVYKDDDFQNSLDKLSQVTKNITSNYSGLMDMCTISLNELIGKNAGIEYTYGNFISEIIDADPFNYSSDSRGFLSGYSQDPMMGMTGMTDPMVGMNPAGN